MPAPRTIADSPDRPGARRRTGCRGARVHRGPRGFIVDEPDPGAVGHAAFVGGVELSALHRLKSGLEESFLSLVSGGEHE